MMGNRPILVVEDVPQVRELLEIALRFRGYEVVSAADGEEALAYIAQHPPALVVTDILMPRLDGYALAYRLRRDPKTRDIPIIFISATYVHPEDRAFALRLGAARFLEKPIDTEEFLLTVAEVLAQHEAGQPTILDEQAFYRSYSERLEAKLRQKTQQIHRLERLLPTLPEDQRVAYESLLKELYQHQATIREELEDVYQRLRTSGREST